MLARLIYSIGLIICFLFISGCCPPPSSPPIVNQPVYTLEPSSPGYIYCRTIPVGSFDQVVFHGNIIGTVNGHAPSTELRLIGDTPNAYATVSACTKNGVLYVQYATETNKPIKVELDLANPVHKILVSGNARMTFKNVGDAGVNIYLAGNSQTMMTGNILVQSLNVSDNAVLHAYWLNTRNLQISASGLSNIFIAGLVSNLDLYASDSANIDARYLRVDNAFLILKDNADVGVNIKRAQSSMVAPSATLYYYRDPHFRADYLYGNGADLRMPGMPPNY